MANTANKNNVPAEESRWGDVAASKYGPSIVDVTLPLYCGSHRAMVEDDNVRGAVPVLPLSAPSPWRMNRPSYFFLCLLVRLQFHREDDELRLYLDARGERDLRNPGDSSVERRPLRGAEAGATQRDRVVAVGNGDDLLSGEFVSVASVPGHFKGYLSFHAAQFQKPGKYWFTFADIRRHASYRQMMAAMEARGVPRTAVLPMRDYPEIMLFEVREEGRLIDAFADESGSIRYVLPASPFAGEGEEEERARFAPFVGDDVLKRHEVEGSRRRKWWVSPDDDGVAPPQRLVLVDPSGKGLMTTTLKNPNP